MTQAVYAVGLKRVLTNLKGEDPGKQIIHKFGVKMHIFVCFSMFSFLIISKVYFHLYKIKTSECGTLRSIKNSCQALEEEPSQ